MDKNTSFIPKKSLIKVRQQKQSINLFLFISLFVFFLSLGMYAGLFFYKTTIEDRLQAKNSELESTISELDPENIIVRARDLNVTIDAAKKLLAEHIAISPFFDILEEIILTNVYLSSFSFDASDSGTPTSPQVGIGQEEAGGTTFSVTLNGVAPGYSSLALQLDSFREQDGINSVDLRQMELSSNGSVRFSIDMSLDRSIVSYADDPSRGAEASESLGTFEFSGTL